MRNRPDHEVFLVRIKVEITEVVNEVKYLSIIIVRNCMCISLHLYKRRQVVIQCTGLPLPLAPPTINRGLVGPLPPLSNHFITMIECE